MSRFERFTAWFCMVFAIFSVFFAYGITIYGNSLEPKIDADYVEYAKALENEYGVSAAILIALIENESSGNTDAVSSNGHCKGLCQLDDRYFDGDLFNPYWNMRLATEHLLYLFEEYEGVEIVLTAYNTGEYSKATQSAINTGFGNEYAKRICKRAEQIERLWESQG